MLYKLDNLYAVIIKQRKPIFEYYLIKLKDTPHYKFLEGNKKEYLDYLKIENKEKHSEEIYTNMINNFKSNNIKITCKMKNDKMIIFDGLHRACILLFNRFEYVNIKLIKKFSIIDKTKYYKLI